MILVRRRHLFDSKVGLSVEDGEEVSGPFKTVGLGQVSIMNMGAVNSFLNDLPLKKFVFLVIVYEGHLSKLIWSNNCLVIKSVNY